MDKKKILLVDDSPGITEAVGAALEATGKYAVQAVNEATQALPAALAFKPDLILIDYLMPYEDGGSIARHLRAEEDLRDVRIIFVTDMAQEGEETGLGDLVGTSPAIPKSAGVPGVLRAVEEALK
ncbi:MAG: response regulator [Candidatus Omnitrophica bacterium]|nr:response regulator [Candidatus Omnitrophota bacterium]